MLKIGIIKCHLIQYLKNKTLLQDNVRFHHSKIVKEFAKNNNIEMNYIPGIFTNI